MTKRRIIAFSIAVIFCLSLPGYSWRALHRPIDAVTVSSLGTVKDIPAGAVSLPWPEYGGSALSIDGVINLQHGSTKQTPTASTAKVMTALAILDKKPLSPGTDGPIYVITADDVTIYNNYVAKNGSVAAVQAGTPLTERQMLQALMLPSANNIADTLVTWAFGSMQDYVTFANRKAAELGMKDSYFADASGFSPATLSTPADLVKLGNAAVANGTLMEIAAQRTAVIPVAGTIYNVNSLLGQDGVIGLKTGNTDEAGGCFMMAGRITPAGASKPITVVTAIMAAPTRAQALADSLPFMKTAAANFETVTVAKAGTPLYDYAAPWGGKTTVTASKDISVLRWKGDAIKPSVKTDALRKSYAANQTVGSVSAKTSYGATEAQLHTTQSIDPPSNWWLLTHPF